MTTIHRLSMIGAVIVCLVGVQANVTLFAAEDQESLVQHRLNLDVGLVPAHPLFTLEPASATSSAAQVYRGRRSRMTRSGSVAAIMLGAAATIAGSAILVYANRPECSTNQFAG